MSMSGVATSKGTILKSLVKFIEQDLSAEQKTKLFEMLSADDAALARGRVLSSQFVPEAMLNRLTDSAAKAKGEDIDRFGVRAGLAELADSIGVYRFLLVVLTPNALLSKASSFWGSVHNRGTMVVLEHSDNHARVQLKDFPSERPHCARLTGWFQGLAEMTKVKNISIRHDKCMTRGAEHCEWIMRWNG